MNQRDPAFENVCEYIEANLRSKITMSNLEEYAGLTGRALQFKFKKYLNKTPFQYIEERKLLKAHDLIREYQRSKTISDIALELRFSHIGRFSMNFKRKFGIYPSVLARS
jgi:transcriptional regulator GlxA family with amidase domain